MTPPTDARIRGAVVGAGHMGQYHILALAELWGVDLVGVVDTDLVKAQQVAAPYGVPAFASHRELAGLIDFATVAVPTDRHFETARAVAGVPTAITNGGMSLFTFEQPPT